MSNQRRGTIPGYLKDPYVQEYRRLKVEPEQHIPEKYASNGPQRDFRISSPLKKRGLNGPVSQPKNEGTYIRGTEKTPMPVYVGGHDDQVWRDGSQDSVDVESLQGSNPLSDNQYFDVDSPADQSSEEEFNNQNISFSNLQPEQYIVMYQDSVVSVSKDPEEIKKVVEYLMMKVDAPLEDIVVLKRISLDFGVVLS